MVITEQELINKLENVPLIVAIGTHRTLKLLFPNSSDADIIQFMQNRPMNNLFAAGGRRALEVISDACDGNFNTFFDNLEQLIF